MTDLSPEARELIARARPAERADASAKQRVRAALTPHLVPPPVPPAAEASVAGSLGVAASASKLVLICSLTAAGVVGTAALVKARHAAEVSPTSQEVARVAPRATEPLAPPVLASPAAQAREAHAARPPASPAREIARPVLASRDGEAARRIGQRARAERAAEPVEVPSLVVVPESASVIPPERATGTTPKPVSNSVLEPRPDLPNPSSSWRASDFPSPIPNRRVTRITSTPSLVKTCSAARELELLSGAQAALRESAGQRALDLLEQHAKSCPAATFWQERSAARVLALCLLHHEQQAFAEAAQLASRAPRSPLLARLRSSCAAAALTSSAKPEGQR